MAGDWIKMRTTLANDPAVIAIACALDIGEFEVVGMLHHLWSWADAQSRNGHAAGVTKKWVDRYVHRDGFADSMCAVGWLVMDDSGLTIPNFDRHNGKPAKDRALAGERQRNKRSNVTQEVTDVSRDERDNSVTREEKRRDKDQDQDQKKPPTPRQPKLVKAKPANLNADDLEGLGVDRQHAVDWLAVRAKKRAPLTPTAWDLMVTEAKAANITIARAVQIAAQRGWQSLKAEWLEKENGRSNTGAGGQSRPSLVDRVRQANAHLFEDEPPAWEQASGAFDAEFERIDEADGSLVGSDD